MAMPALRLVAVQRSLSICVAASNIFLMRHGLKMAGANTSRVAAEMIEL